MIPALEGLSAALLDLDPAAARRLASDIETMSCRLPRRARMALALGTAGAEVSTMLLTGRRLGSLSQERRERVLARLSRWNATADLIDALKVPVLLVHGATAAAPELAARLDGPPARPDAYLDVTSASEWPSRSVCDVVVIGSGAGGAMAARSIARSGARTVVLEEGRRFGVEDFRSGSALDRFTALYRDGGATAALGRPPVVLPVGRGVGGTTLVNSGTCYRTPDEVLQSWRDRHGLALADPTAFGPLLDDVEATLQVAPVPTGIMGNNGRLALAGAAALGWSAHPLRRNAPGCGGSCQCAVGCPRNAKFGVHLNALPQACQAGARIVSEARADAILHARGHVSGVRARRADGSAFEILAHSVVVAAGATETPLLLRRSGLGSHPQLGRNLSMHPATSTAGWFDERVESTRGVLQSAGIDEFHNSDGILVEATSTPPGMGSMVLPGSGSRLAARLERFEHLATVGAMVADAPVGRVYGTRGAIVRYDLTRRDADRLIKAIGIMGRVLLAAGATEVLTGIRGYESARTEADLDEAVSHAHPARMHLAAFHPTGTARMGADAELHPVDEHGRLRGAEGVWVADGSVVPSCPGVNPQLTIMALALAVSAGLTGTTSIGR